MNVLDALARRDPSDQPTPPPAPPAHSWLDTVTTVWHDYAYQAFLATAAIVVLLIVLAFAAGRIIRATRGASGNAKLTVGTALVQAGNTWVVVTGTYVFCIRIFHVPVWEAVAFAVFFEAATWVSVGMIRAHAKGVDKDGKPNEGFGPAGPFFWIFVACGGLLAIIGGDTSGAKAGRAVVVVIGTCLWYLTLLRWVKRSSKPGRFKWTPRALLVAIGAVEPGDHDVRDENREWQVRRLARAMRWMDSGRPWSWLGKRALIRRGEATKEDVIADARRRYAVTHLLTTTCAPDSDVMKRVIADVKADATRTPIAVRRLIVPSGLSITEQNGAPNGHPIAEQITEQITVPIADQDTRTDADQYTRTDTGAIGPNTPDQNTPNTVQVNTDQIADQDIEANVRPITSARRAPNGASAETTKNLDRVKRKFKTWRTEMPSARMIGNFLGVSPSTGYSYQQKLVAERDAPNTPNTAPAPDGDDAKERQAVVAS